MSTDIPRQHALYKSARLSWGAEAAETLMDLLPPDRDELATKTDVAELRLATQTDLRLLKADVAVLRADMGAMGAELRTEIADLRGDLLERMSDQTRLLMITMLGTTVTIVLAILGAAFRI